jgi:hypothetical protein
MNWFEFSLNGFLAVFIVLNVVNVVIQTVKSIATIKCGAVGAAAINALAYGLYTVVVVYMSADGLGLFWKAIIIALANLIGVYVVKVIEKKKRKDRLWKVEATIEGDKTDRVHNDLKANNIPHNFITDIGKYSVFNIYCETQTDSQKAKIVLDYYEAKYFVSESKIL